MCACACICLSACCPWRYNQPVSEMMWRQYLPCASLLFWLYVQTVQCTLLNQMSDYTPNIRKSKHIEMIHKERCVFAFDHTERPTNSSTVMRTYWNLKCVSSKKSHTTFSSTNGMFSSQEYERSLPWKKGVCLIVLSVHLCTSNCKVLFKMGYILFWWSTLDILLTISNFATTCQLTLMRVWVSC